MADRPHFNLINEPFIPCVTLEGHPVEFGLRDVLVRAHELQQLRDDSPLVTIALHRLLLAIVHAALEDPQTLDDWTDIWQAGCFDAVAIDEYFQKWRDRFDLFNERRPFYQGWGWELPREKRKGPNELAQERTRGNNATLFDHTTDDPALSFSYAEAARNLIANQTFAAAGGVSATGNRTGAPLVGQVVVMPVGQTLWQTLSLNCLPASDRSEALQVSGQPVWERGSSSLDDSAVPRGYLDLLTWQPRRVRLHVESGYSDVRQISYSQGRRLELPEGCFDPMTAYRQERALEFDAGRSVWRDSEVLFSKSVEGIRRPVVMDFLEDLIYTDLVAESHPVSLACAGLKNRQAKVFFWRHELLPLPLNYVTDRDLAPRLARAVEDAEVIGQRLKDATKDAVSEFLDPRNQRPDPSRRAQVVESLAAERLYWSQLETPFRRFFLELSEIPEDQTDRRDRRMAKWAIEDCERSAKRAFEESVGRLDQSARALRAQQLGRDSLGRRIGKYIKDKKYREAHRDKDQS